MVILGLVFLLAGKAKEWTLKINNSRVLNDIMQVKFVESD